MIGRFPAALLLAASAPVAAPAGQAMPTSAAARAAALAGDYTAAQMELVAALRLSQTAPSATR